MGVLVSSLILKARSEFNDLVNDHFTTDDLSDQVDGSNTRFKVLNQNLVDLATGAPADPTVYANNTPVAGTFNLATGIFTATVAPTAGSLCSAEYYFVLVEDATYIQFAQRAAEWIGVTPLFTLTTEDSKIDPLLEDGAAKYMASLAAKKMSNLSSWYYEAHAADKGFNKNTISQKFKDMAKDLNAEAIASRDGVYLRQGQRNAPAQAVLIRRPFPSYTPKR